MDRKGKLIYGPLSAGKSEFVKACATEADCSLLTIQISSLIFTISNRTDEDVQLKQY
jgi:ATP-dependent 26S proteasome regulatory subunit